VIDIKWLISFSSLLLSLLIALPATADVHTGTYHLTVASDSGNQGNGPLQGLLPQMNDMQQWVLLGLGILGLILLVSLIPIWWRNRQTIKEQP